jgi:hypothetical protein
MGGLRFGLIANSGKWKWSLASNCFRYRIQIQKSEIGPGFIPVDIFGHNNGQKRRSTSFLYIRRDSWSDTTPAQFRLGTGTHMNEGKFGKRIAENNPSCRMKSIVPLFQILAELLPMRFCCSTMFHNINRSFLLKVKAP